ADERAPAPAPLQSLARNDQGYQIIARQSGGYTLKTAAGQTKHFDISALPAPIELTGNWSVDFAPNRGAPPSATFNALTSWSTNPDPGIKYFSGTATYQKTFEISDALRLPGRRLFLDLGQVEVMADVILNGK